MTDRDRFLENSAATWAGLERGDPPTEADRQRYLDQRAKRYPREQQPQQELELEAKDGR